jgi:amino acid transporter
LFLEFVALIVLRFKEPQLPRPFKIPGGIPVLVGLALAPTTVMVMALIANHGERFGPISTLTLGAFVILLGAGCYPFLLRKGRTGSRLVPDTQ